MNYMLKCKEYLYVEYVIFNGHSSIHFKNATKELLFKLGYYNLCRLQKGICGIPIACKFVRGVEGVVISDEYFLSYESIDSLLKQVKRIKVLV